jgi:hypothetical protein
MRRAPPVGIIPPAATPPTGLIRAGSDLMQPLKAVYRPDGAKLLKGGTKPVTDRSSAGPTMAHADR